MAQERSDVDSGLDPKKMAQYRCVINITWLSLMKHAMLVNKGQTKVKKTIESYFNSIDECQFAELSDCVMPDRIVAYGWVLGFIPAHKVLDVYVLSFVYSCFICGLKVVWCGILAFSMIYLILDWMRRVELWCNLSILLSGSWRSMFTSYASFGGSHKLG